MIFDSIKFTNKVLMIFAVTLVLYILKVLSFIFVPLAFACIISLAFMPFMRWAAKRKLPKYFALTLVLVAIGLILIGAFEMLQMSIREIMSGQAEMYLKLDAKLGKAVEPLIQLLGIDVVQDNGLIKGLVHNNDFQKDIASLIGPGLMHIKNFTTTLGITIFLIVLILAGSVNFPFIMQEMLFNTPTQAIEVYHKIERSISTFLSVKVASSLITGICFGVACWAFGISFPVMWGMLAFGLNFIQMIGSIIVTIGTGLMAVIEIDHTGALIAAILVFIGIQIVIGSILEPIMMGKSFKINVVTVLLMLLFWGFLWGIPGMVLAVPMAVLIKILCEQFDHTRSIARIMS